MSKLIDSSELSAQDSDKLKSSQFRAAVSSIDPIKDISRLGSIPCARSSLLVGMATAAGVAGISFVAGRGLKRGLNWGVGSFCFVSLVSWETCRRSRRAEAQRIKTVIEGYQKYQTKQSVPIIESSNHESSSLATSTETSS